MCRIPYSARLVAGFCWPWSNPDSSGQLVDDVKLDGFSMPWNAMPDAGKLAPGIPKSNFWASDPNGINQVGCLYTAQGFEFDYAGVIFGRDLVYDAGWRGNRKISQDSVVKKAAEEEFVNLVKQTYRVLLTRGMKGCYVYFEDVATKENPHLLHVNKIGPRRPYVSGTASWHESHSLNNTRLWLLRVPFLDPGMQRTQSQSRLRESGEIFDGPVSAMRKPISRTRRTNQRGARN